MRSVGGKKLEHVVLLLSEELPKKSANIREKVREGWKFFYIPYPSFEELTLKQVQEYADTFIEKVKEWRQRHPWGSIVAEQEDSHFFLIRHALGM